MAEFLRSWIMNIAVIVIFVMFLETIMLSGSMKRYVNVVIGLLIIIVIIRPFLLIKDYAESFNEEYVETVKFLEQGISSQDSMEISRYQQEKALDIFEKNLERQIVKLVRNKTGIEEDEILVELELDNDLEGENFGGIKSVKVSLSRGQERVIEVDKVKIEVGKTTGKNKNVINKDKVEYNLNDSTMNDEIKDAIGKALGISESIISVNVQQQ